MEFYCPPNLDFATNRKRPDFKNLSLQINEPARYSHFLPWFFTKIIHFGIVEYFPSNRTLLPPIVLKTPADPLLLPSNFTLLPLAWSFSVSAVALRWNPQVSLSPDPETSTRKPQVSVLIPRPRPRIKDSDLFLSLCALCCIYFNTVYTVVCVTYASHCRSFIFSASITENQM